MTEIEVRVVDAWMLGYSPDVKLDRRTCNRHMPNTPETQNRPGS
ncbi:MAG: hypothetical protein ACXWD8_07325 [Mycobacterium sp.]